MESALGLGEGDLEIELKRLKYSRRGKKSAITKRIRQITGLIKDYASRRRLQVLLDALLTVYGELEGVCNSIEIHSGGADDEYNNIEVIRMEVDDCKSLVEEYLERRKDDTPSNDALTASWIEKHQPGYIEESSCKISAFENDESNTSGRGMD